MNTNLSIFKTKLEELICVYCIISRCFISNLINFEQIIEIIDDIVHAKTDF